MPSLVQPHGGTLVDRVVPPTEADAFRAEARALPSLVLDARELADLELIGTGAASPLAGFLGSADYESVLARLRLADGTVWSLPLTLAVSDEDAARLERGAPVALRDAAGRLAGILVVREIHRRDPLAEARVLMPDAPPFARHRLSPRELRARIAERGWSRVAGFQTRNPIHRAHEHLTKLALEFTDGLVIHPLVGETKGDDVPAEVRFRAYEALLERYYPPDRTLLAAFPAAMRYAGPREALFHALVRKNYGITHFIVGRDHAGVGRYYGPLEAQEIFEQFTPGELGVTPLRFEATFFCHACDMLASPRTCPHPASDRLDLSGSRVREILRAGGHLPSAFTRPEVAEILRTHLGAAPYGRVLRRPGGFILWCAGLSGAGKSTLAERVRDVLSAERAVEILDGDEVRTHLSKGLGFSREDRDTNIRRIGFVARLLARNGVVAITAAISPYAETRAEMRRLAEEEGIPFVEIYAQAALDSLVRRDVKGLYRKALAGEIAHFTGVSDPYEPPAAPEVVLQTDREDAETSLVSILGFLGERGLAAASRRAA